VWTHNIGFGTLARTTLDRRNGHNINNMFDGQTKQNRTLRSTCTTAVILYCIYVYNTICSLFDVCLLNFLITIFRAADSHVTYLPSSYFRKRVISKERFTCEHHKKSSYHHRDCWKKNKNKNARVSIFLLEHNRLHRALRYAVPLFECIMIIKLIHTLFSDQKENVFSRNIIYKLCIQNNIVVKRRSHKKYVERRACF